MTNTPHTTGRGEKLTLIIKGSICSHCFEYDCEHSKPHKDAKLKPFPVWQERTCTIKEFDKKFGEQEGFWLSKGTEHCEVDCKNTGCSWHTKGHKHCRRRVEDKDFWCIEFSSLEQLVLFFEEVGYCKIYEEDQDGCGLTADIDTE